jgi:hypothetical protein
MVENEKDDKKKLQKRVKVLIEPEEDNPVSPGNILDVSIEVYQTFMVQRRRYLV